MILSLFIVVDICLHHYQILLTSFQKMFIKECDEYKSNFENKNLSLIKN